MSDETESTPSATTAANEGAAPSRAASKKAAKKAAKKSAQNSGTLATQADAAQGAESLEDLERQIKMIELQTAQLNLERQKDANADYIADREGRNLRERNAQVLLDRARRDREALQKLCAHRTGGFGLDDFYNGDGKTAMISMQLPIQGMQFICCSRCGWEVITPHPSLKRSNPEVYAAQLQIYLEALHLLRGSYMAKPMSGPIFSFENEYTGQQTTPPII